MICPQNDNERPSKTIETNGCLAEQQLKNHWSQWFGNNDSIPNQACKPQSYASSKLQLPDQLSCVVYTVECRATSVAENCV